MFQSSVKGISPKQAYEIIQNDTNVVLLDVRTPSEYASTTGHLWYRENGQNKDALLIPIQELQPRLPELEPYKGKTIIAYCRSGNRSRVATEFLTKRGFTVLNLLGGIIEWHEQNLPVVRSAEQ